MRAALLDYSKVSQILRADVEFFIQEVDLDKINIQSSFGQLLDLLDSSQEEVSLVHVGNIAQTGFSAHVVSGQFFIYTLKLFLDGLQEEFQCFLSIYKLYILTSDGGIAPDYDFDRIERVHSDQEYVKQVISEKKEYFEALVYFLKSHVSKSVMRFELKPVVTSIIQEYALMDELGRVKEDIKALVLNNLKLKDIPRELLPNLFYRRIQDNPNHALAHSTIQELLDTGEDGLNRYFDKVTQPILKACDSFLELVSYNMALYYLSYMRQLPIPLLSHEGEDDDILSLLDKLISEVESMAELGYFDVKEKRSIDYVQAYFSGESLEDLAIRFKLSRERVRQIVKKESVFAKIFNKQSNIYVGEHFYNVLYNFKSIYLNNDLVNSVLPDDDLSVIKNKLYFLGLDLFEMQVNNESKYFLTDKTIVSIRQYINSFIQFSKSFFLAKDIDSYYEDFIAFYKIDNRKGYDESLADDKSLFEQILQCSFIERIEGDDDEEMLYVIDWNLLSSLDLRVGSILYDAGVTMSREEIFNEYNSRCAYYGEEALISKDKLHIRSIDNIRKVRNDIWKYSEEEIDVKDNTQSLISEFLLSKGGVASFAEIKERLAELGRVYKDNSLRAFILMVATITKQDSQNFVHKDKVDELDIEVVQSKNSMIGAMVLPIIKERLLSLTTDVYVKDFNKAIKNEIQAEGISSSRNINISYYLDLLINAGAVQIENDFILFDSLDKAKIEKVNYRNEPAYREAIRNAAVVLLKENNNEPMRLSELWDSLGYLYPKELSRNNFYKIFNSSAYFQKFQDENGKTLCALQIENLPEAKSVNEQVYAPAEGGQVLQTEPHLTVEKYNKIQRTAWSSDALFDFIYMDLTVKLKDQNWDFNAGFERFRNVLEGRENHNGQHLMWGEAIINSLGKVLMNMSDYFDRDTCMQRLTLSFESYLRLLLKDEYGLGLGSLVYSNMHLRVLKDYKNMDTSDEKNKTLLYFSKKLNSLMHFRNIYAHDPNSDKVQISLVDHIRNIMDFISLYIFLAAVIEK